VPQYYLGLHSSIESDLAMVWTLDTQVATCVETGQVNKILSGTIPNVVVEDHPGWRFIPLKLAPGEYYPRMARPRNTNVRESPGFHPANAQYREVIETGRGQLVALREQLERIFRTVHPVPKNFAAYGHDVRNLLILAATEVEAHWKGVLTANGASGGSTNDYVKLLPAMKLDEYTVRLSFYPSLPAVRPFKSWSSEAPTKSLPWYGAYNAVKHDRETLFEQGTLLRTLEAVCACTVMLYAQFGMSGFSYREEINSYFEMDSVPKWDKTEVYASLKGVADTPIMYPF
jgi:hypothetical protein